MPGCGGSRPSNSSIPSGNGGIGGVVQTSGQSATNTAGNGGNFGGGGAAMVTLLPPEQVMAELVGAEVVGWCSIISVWYRRYWCSANLLVKFKMKYAHIKNNVAIDVIQTDPFMVLYLVMHSNLRK